MIIDVKVDMKVYRKKNPQLNNGNDDYKEAWLESSKNTTVSCQAFTRGSSFIIKSIAPATAYLL